MIRRRLIRPALVDSTQTKPSLSLRRIQAREPVRPTRRSKNSYRLMGGSPPTWAFSRMKTPPALSAPLLAGRLPLFKQVRLFAGDALPQGLELEPAGPVRADLAAR